MISHSVERCPDDLATLRVRLDELAREKVRIVTVLWQPQRVEDDQAAALGARGSFVIVTEQAFEDPLREREDEISEGAVMAEVAGLN